MNIQTAKRTDLPDIRALLEESALPIAGIADHVETAIVAREGAALAGCAAVEIYGAAGLLRSVAVAPALRGTGLGRRLTADALSLAQSRGVRTVYLLTTTADRFFPRFGFVPIERHELDPALRASEELRGACPASAVAMRLAL